MLVVLFVNHYLSVAGPGLSYNVLWWCRDEQNSSSTMSHTSTTTSRLWGALLGSVLHHLSQECHHYIWRHTRPDICDWKGHKEYLFGTEVILESILISDISCCFDSSFRGLNWKGEKVFEDEFLVYNNKYQSSPLLPLYDGGRVAKLIYLWLSFQSNTRAVKNCFRPCHTVITQKFIHTLCTYYIFIVPIILSVLFYIQLDGHFIIKLMVFFP